MSASKKIARYADKISAERRIEIAKILETGSFPESASLPAASRNGVPWSAYEDAHIIHCRTVRALATPAIAEIVGRSLATTYDRFRKLDTLIFTRQVWSDDDYARALTLLEDPANTVNSVAASLGRSAESLRSKLNYEHVKLNRMPIKSTTPASGQRTRLHNAASARADKAAIHSSRPRFNETEIATIRAAATPEDAVAVLGRTRTQILQKAYAIGKRFESVSRCEWNDTTKARLATLIGEGKDFDSIAQTLRSSKRQVRTHALALGLADKKRERRGLTDATKALARDLARGETSITHAAKLLRCDIRTLKVFADQEGFVFPAAVRVKSESAAAKTSKAKAPVARKEHKAKVAKTRPKDASPVKDTVSPAGQKSKAAPLAAIALAVSLSSHPAAIAKGAPAAAPRASKKLRRVKLRDRLADTPRRPTSLAPAAPLPSLPAPVRVNTIARPAAVPYSYRGQVYRLHSKNKATTHASAIALSRETHDDVAKFLKEVGVTRYKSNPIDEVINAVRARGYSVVRTAKGFLIDGYIALDNTEALSEFAQRRAIIPRAKTAHAM